MNLNDLSAPWTALAPALGDHLWQATLFALTAGLLTLILRKNHAHVRYGLWLAASLKFLIPFSLLVGIGSHLAWSRPSAGTTAGFYLVMDEVSQPFTQPTMPIISGATRSTVSLNLIRLLPTLLAAVWLCGFVAVLLVWYTRWRRVSAAIREGVPLREGREVEELRRLERMGRSRKQIEMLRSRSSLEPGIFGVARPVLIWPEGLSERLDDAHLETILAHEVRHVRRRDNLAAAIHMVVEAMFWFHPLVWWLGARLVEERERACDEEVLQFGSDRQVYAESILQVCEFCLDSPLACVSGVTGADLRKRMVYIMNENVARKLDFGRKLLLGAAALVAVAAPIIFGLLTAAPGRAEAQTENAAAITTGFEVATIKPTAITPDKSGSPMVKLLSRPDSYSGVNVALQTLIRDAYGVGDYQISGAPDWLNLEKYDIEVKVDSSVAEGLRKLSMEQGLLERNRMLQALLAERLKLTLHRETKELSIYELAVAPDGPKLQESKPGDAYPNTSPDGRGGARWMQFGPGQLTGQGVPVGDLANYLSRRLGRTVLDKTRLTGKYNFTLQTPSVGNLAPFDKRTAERQQGTDSASLPELSDDSILTAIQEQLGLKLEPAIGQVEVLVIDHVERPSEN
jgi:bla regulator protein BlaR1